MPDRPHAPVWAVVTARMSSTRLPGKSMATLAGRPALVHLLDRLRAVPGLDGTLVATSDRDDDEPIRRVAVEAGVPCAAGSLDDVLARVAGAVRELGARTVVLATGDCPMLDPAIVQRVLDEYIASDVDYASSVLTEVLTYPAGHSVEVFRADLLDEIDRTATTPEEREHVTAAFYRRVGRYRLLPVEAPPEEARSDIWLCIDTADDYRGISAIFNELYDDDPLFGYRDVLALLERHPALVAMNASNGRR